MSGSDPLLLFAVGKAQGEMTIEVTCGVEKRASFKRYANRIYEIDEQVRNPNQLSRSPFPPNGFQRVSELIAHVHHEEPYDDFERTAAARKLSQLGPGVSCSTWMATGMRDLIVGSGRADNWCLSERRARWVCANRGAAIQRAATRDQTTVWDGEGAMGSGDPGRLACYETDWWLAAACGSTSGL